MASPFENGSRQLFLDRGGDVFQFFIIYNLESMQMLLSYISQVQSWKQKLPLQTIMRMLQVLVPQVEKICMDK